MQRILPLVIIGLLIAGIIVFVSVAIGEYGEVIINQARARVAEAEAQREAATADRVSAEADATRADAELEVARGQRVAIEEPASAAADAVRMQTFLVGLWGVLLPTIVAIVAAGIVGAVALVAILWATKSANDRRELMRMIAERDAARERAQGRIIIAREGGDA